MSSDFSAKNLLLVTYDCARADITYKLGLKNLKRLIDRGITFENCKSSAPLTPISHATVFSGLQPCNHGLRHMFQSKIHPSIKLLAEHLVSEGFDTSAIVACPGLNRWYGFSKGFVRYDDVVSRMPDGTEGLECTNPALRGFATKRAPSVSQRGLKVLQTMARYSERWFCFLHYFDAHWPYQAPEDFGQEGENDYEKELRYLDHYFGEVLDWLEAENLMQSTAIVAFGDHGEDLAGLYPNDKSGASGPHPEEDGHGRLLFETTQHVPLVIATPGITPKSVKEMVGLVDLLPTMLSILNIPFDPTALDGCSLLQAMTTDQTINRNYPLYAETCLPLERPSNKAVLPEANRQALWIDAKQKIIRDMDQAGTSLTYDLERDPNELMPVQTSESGWDMNLVQWPNCSQYS